MKRIALNTLVVVVLLAAVVVAWYLRGPIVLFVLSLATAAALRPMAEWLQQRKVPRGLAVGATYLLVAGILGSILFLAGTRVADDLQRAGEEFLPAYGNLSAPEVPRGPIADVVVQLLPPVDELTATVTRSWGVAFPKAVLGATFSLVGTLLDGMVMIVMSLYWSFDRSHFERLWLSLLPVPQRTQTRHLWRTIETELGAYLSSELVQSLVAGGLLWLGFRILGQPYPALLAVAGGIAWLIPWVGVVLAVAGVLLISLPQLVAGDLLIPLLASGYTLGVLLAMETWIEPWLFHRRRYNSLLVAIVILCLADAFGVIGLLLGPPLAAALQLVSEQLLRERPRQPQATTIGSGDTLPERLTKLELILARIEDPGPEIVNLMQRLRKLIAEAELQGG